MSVLIAVFPSMSVFFVVRALAWSYDGELAEEINDIFALRREGGVRF